MEGIILNKELNEVEFSEEFLTQLEDYGIVTREIIEKPDLKYELIQFTSSDMKTMFTITRLLSVNFQGKLELNYENELNKAIENEDYQKAQQIQNQINKLKN